MDLELEELFYRLSLKAFIESLLSTRHSLENHVLNIDRMYLRSTDRFYVGQNIAFYTHQWNATIDTWYEEVAFMTNNVVKKFQ